jgi:hypothetical protein
MFGVGVLVGIAMSIVAFVGLLLFMEYTDTNRKKKKKDPWALIDLVDNVPHGDREWFKWHIVLAVGKDEPTRPRPYPFGSDV